MRWLCKLEEPDIRSMRFHVYNRFRNRFLSFSATASAGIAIARFWSTSRSPRRTFVTRPVWPVGMARRASSIDGSMTGGCTDPSGGVVDAVDAGDSGACEAVDAVDAGDSADLVEVSDGFGRGGRAEEGPDRGVTRSSWP